MNKKETVYRIANILKDCNVSTIKAMQTSDVEAGTQAVLTATNAIMHLIEQAFQGSRKRENKARIEELKALLEPADNIEENTNYDEMHSDVSQLRDVIEQRIAELEAEAKEQT